MKSKVYCFSALLNSIVFEYLTYIAIEIKVFISIFCSNICGLDCYCC